MWLNPINKDYLNYFFPFNKKTGLFGSNLIPSAILKLL